MATYRKKFSRHKSAFDFDCESIIDMVHYVREVEILEEKKKFDKKAYDIEYRKNHKLRLAVDLSIEEMKELNELIKKAKITKAQFVKNAIKELKKSLKK